MGLYEDERAGRLTSWLGGPAVAPVLTVALAAVALASLGYAWLHREVRQPFLANRTAIDDTLWRTAIVVSAMVALLVCYIVFVWLTRKSAADTVRRRDEMLRYLAPTLLLAAVLGGLARSTGSTADAFKAAAVQEAGLDPVRVVGYSTLAWWCAILAVGVLALLCLQGVPTPRAQPGRTWWRGALLTGFAVLFSCALLTAATLRPVDVPKSRTAAPSDPPPTPELTGVVAFSFDVPKYGRYPLLPGGPGFIREANDDNDSVEAVDGATGQVRWSFARPGLYVSPITVTSAGSDGVVVVFASYKNSPMLIGVEAMTGTPLWTRPGSLRLQFGGYSKEQVSQRGVLAYEDVGHGTRVAVLSPRTGQTVWETTLPADCKSSPGLTMTSVVVPRCEDQDVDLAVTVRDIRTGAVTRQVRTAALDVDPAQFVPNSFVSSNPDTDLIVADFGVPKQYSTSRSRLVDVGTGQVVRALPDDGSANLIDATSLIVRAGGGFSILDLTNDQRIATDVTSEWATSAKGDGEVWARFGRRWVTTLPTLPGGPADAVRIYAADAAVRTLPSPCPVSTTVPVVEALPGALAVNCGPKVVGLR